MMDLRYMWIESPKGIFRPMCSSTTGEFLHRFRFEFEGYTCECPSKMISDFLLTEYQFRVILQLKDGEKGDRENEGMRDGINTEYVRCERNLYFKDSALPSLTLDEMRRFAMKDSKWYIRNTLTNHCCLNGGCCGQNCGCCEKRAGHLPLKGINGHCTWACRCCIERKGFGFKDYDGNIFERQYKDELESDNPVLLLRMADGYFSAPKSRPSLKPESNSDSTYNSQSTSQDIPQDANNDAKAMAKEEIQDSAANIISDPCPPPYKEIAKDDEERKQR
ncbi:hypothetical protein N7481_002769 [Penicillium waksmanii]|uniref:uncharacterized protein n=1 Tax=Penicillium waksmanii TaxID=69791 RepID=UPI0025488A1D|nr:uncharacterized protein N7481_002769 [Penicillium waksmanii]KAJ5995792.1 hypothetical protein N7481_002769 [Penicillium waksmanii]